MSSHRYWIPTNHTDLYEQVNQTWKYFSSYRERMGLGSDTQQGKWIDEAFLPELIRLNETYRAWQNPGERTPVKTSALCTVERGLKEVYRMFYIGYLKNNRNVANEDLLLMGLPKRKLREDYEYHRILDTYPMAHVVMRPPAIVEIHYVDGESRHKARPYGVYGAEIRWAILDEPTNDLTKLIHSVFSLRTPCQLEFDFEQRSKIVYFVLRWASTRGKYGPWSEIYRVVVP
ncbi:MAG: hypothetical protein LBH80_06040 [Prevotellaceae bacterium]|jgi:hypothetical protein|nr:hypothetical protein [Prevotellaceae bacterium]